MAVLTAKGISSVAIQLLARQLSLPRTVTMVPGAEFAGSNGDTITVRVPQPGAGLEQSAPSAALTPADVDEVPVDVSLSHLYHLKNLSDQETDMDIVNFATQVTRVQANAVAVKAELKLAAVMNALTNHSTIKFAKTMSDADTVKQVLLLREELGKNDCPPDDRWLACSPEVVTRLLSLSMLTKVNEAGSSDSLRNAIVGRIYGFNVVESNALTASTAVAYHRSGFVFASKVPSNPKGATSSAGIVGQGLGLRQVFQYDASHAQDQSLVSTYAGAAAVYEDTSGTDNARFVKTHISAT